MDVEKKRDNHYVPQAYLRQWSNNGNTVWTYDTVVRDKRQNAWRSKSVRGVAHWLDFYTQVCDDGTIDDSIEVLFGENYELKASNVLKKVRENEALTSEDMSALIDFAILQMVRTPAAYLNNRTAMGLAFFSAASKTANKFLELERDPNFNENTPALVEALQPNCPPFPQWEFSITMDESTGDYTYSMPMGRKNYLASIGHVLNGEMGKRIRSYRWNVIKMPEGTTLPTCDNPFVRADLRGLDQGKKVHHDLSQCTNCFMPLTPKHLLCADSDADQPIAARLAEDDELLELVNALIVQNALRYVYDCKRSSWIEKLRPRRVDPEYCNRMDDAMRRWNEIQD
ncbi:MAG: DUF4238 domain-containing protein [Atopobiaceae bacterium]|nr:DUF4238 domain-containing protein [Atopobiaceae bacterium]